MAGLSGGSFRHYNSLIFMRVKDVWPICFVVAENSIRSMSVKPGSKKNLLFVPEIVRIGQSSFSPLFDYISLSHFAIF